MKVTVDSRNALRTFNSLCEGQYFLSTALSDRFSRVFKKVDSTSYLVVYDRNNTLLGVVDKAINLTQSIYVAVDLELVIKEI